MAELLNEDELVEGQMYRVYWKRRKGSNILDMEVRFLGSSEGHRLLFDYRGDVIALPSMDFLGAKPLDC